MEIALQVDISRREKRQQLVVCSLFSFGIIGSFFLVTLLCPPLAVPAAGFSLFALLKPISTYLKFRRQYLTPDRLELTPTHLIYFTQNQKTLEIPFRSITATGYKNGLLLWSNQVSCVNPHFPLARFKQQSRSKGCDLFFEFFSPSVQARLQDIVQMEKPHYPLPFQHR